MAQAKPGELRMQWSKRENDLAFSWGGEGACKADSNLLATALAMTPIAGGRTLRGQLEERGYDITTLRFSIRRKKEQTR